MPALSSSRLRLLDEWCPRALDLAEDGAPYDASIFGAGKVAHAALDALHAACARAGGPLDMIAARRIAHDTAATMATRGSRFDGHPEAPVSLPAIRDGLDLALAQFAREGMAIDPTARAELGLGASATWTPESYATATHWRAVVDLVGYREDEDGAVSLYVRDYKSAWSTGASAPQTLQMRGQALLALAHAPSLFPGVAIDRIVREVVNLRTGAVWSESLDLADDATDYALDSWRAEIDALVRAVPARPRAARPGPACSGCPYRLTCGEAPPESLDALGTARRYAALRAESDALESVLRAATDEEPIEVDGYRIGWSERATATPTATAHERLVALYAPDAPPDPRMIGLAKALIGVTGIRDAVKALFPGRGQGEQRDALEAELLRQKTGSTWGFVRAADVERKEQV